MSKWNCSCCSRHGAHRTTPSTNIDAEWKQLRDVNKQLWDIEDDIRDKERQRQFDQHFIELARAVYIRNDERAAVKKTINT